MKLYRCACNLTKWVRADSKITRFRTCDCPTPPYTQKTKTCRGCHKRKKVKDFYRDRRTGNPRPRCKGCMSEENKVWASQNPEKAQAAALKQNKRNHAKYRFGLTPDKYQELLKSFGHFCNICGNPETRLDRKGLSLDHCHTTTKVRGALCGRCNLLLGSAKDSPDILRKAAQYLESTTHGKKTWPALLSE